MIGSLARKFFGSANDRFLRTLQRDVDAINALEPELEKLTDEELKARTPWLKERLTKGETVDDLMIEAFATVREASKRVMGMRHFDVQLIGGMVLHRGMIAEMKTGEGKTLVATLPSYLNGLTGKGVHVVTVNDYLASRDSAWMAKLHNFLGLSVGCIVHDMYEEDRAAAYAADITYGTNNEYGFDYLRDNMKYMREHMVQRPFNFAIVDEVDSILIDEARTPLIISGPTQDNSELYRRIDEVILKITEEDFEKDEKGKTVVLTEEGVQHIESLLDEAGDILKPDTRLYDIDNVSVVHHVNQALKAHQLFTRDVDYIVKDDKLVIIDEFTGRMMEGRRYSEGLHQALEAKEAVTIQNENQTLASITFQNYFRMYPKLSGMTGTAMTEANEFGDIYKLEVIEIPTNVPIQRIDEDDAIYRTAQEKYEAIIDQIVTCHQKNQPILVGTVSIEKSEYLSKMLTQRDIPHQVLNARHHESEAHIIAQAGAPGAATIATNMAGRGTDIMLGGNPEMRIAEETAHFEDERLAAACAEGIREETAVAKQQALDAGGLFVLATERHESRRIDNQLRGRSGRQGDPGHTKFFLSTEDDLMRIFGGERMSGMLEKLGMPEGEAINHPWLNRAIEKAQQKVENRNYETRKNLLKFDDVMNDQRKVIYDQRIEIMESEDVSDIVQDMRSDVNEDMIARHMPEKSYADQWDVEGLEKDIFRVYGVHVDAKSWAEEEGVANDEILQRINDLANAIMLDKENEFGVELMRIAEKRLLLQTVDELWKDHLLSLDHLRQGISLRAYGQRDPLNEYKQEAFNMFEALLNHLREMVTQRLSHIRLRVEAMDAMEQEPEQEMHEGRMDPALAAAMASKPQPVPPPMPEGMPVGTIRNSTVAPEARDPQNPETWGKVARNETCPCGSGKKFKHCHGVLA
ncbi:MAG: preprotein translocase subunit SecA [Alphaproteobacteria bacterium]|nr:preprotein translocase subunit SecA [Alphaproteobacteria bacterium]